MDTLKMMAEEIKGQAVRLSSLSQDDTVLVVVDMIEGFVNEGALASPRVRDMAGNIADLCGRMNGYCKIFFTDCHDAKAVEFASFPSHCVRRTREVEIIDCLAEYANRPEALIIEKNSTNGFLSEGFQWWIEENENTINNFVVTGCVTDMCVMQFALTLKAYFNECDMDKRVIVPINGVETYDLGSHSGDLTGLFALYNMHCCGVETVEKIL